MSNDASPRLDEVSATEGGRVPRPSGALASVLAMVAESETLLSDVERALERLDAGSYARCEVCGDAIDPARLEASPVSRRCQAHAD